MSNATTGRQLLEAIRNDLTSEDALQKLGELKHAFRDRAVIPDQPTIEVEIEIEAPWQNHH